MTPLLSLKDIVTKVNTGTPNEVMILQHLNLDIYDGDFITVLGSNGAGKSTLFNTIGGGLPVDEGHITLHGKDITHTSVEKRTAFLARVFQDPKMGTAPRMTVAENLLLALHRGKRRTLRLRRLKQQLPHFKAITTTMQNGLETRLNTATENLSGGQRQALSFLMATEQRPDLLLLDEHTAALDPKTSAELMHQTNERVTQENLTCLMITHHLDDALKYGNRLIVLDQGKIKFDVRGDEKKQLTKEKLLSFFDTIE
ncbi:ABC transporter ATP-binding protein [Lactiplantibacillus fabifermentans]|uniref:ABC superfamily ATP binding cassette transporter, ABC protein n=2 Tax=Lactiplantibacillus fabifermentans TaxID=483011 RepID=A0A0R2NU32_9LACO|nr:ATP-binding cassette domain-containing protein [Lactiplantibacillus fabifermentans]ETY73634.1 phosphonate ABC transporter ATP-binding protein [Lactiplantibacillus fabifermentans T30PCM01]KRO29192.1 ABC superfamily ATP binding cassette transporter, ABC protein [Lactiplantibacillus fabifermentans DSM 21115]